MKPNVILADAVSPGFMAVLGFVFIFFLIIGVVWRGDKNEKKFNWEQRDATIRDQLKIILIIAAVFLVCIILAAFGID